MPTILTLTPNPAIDVSTAVTEIKPVHKLRCHAVRRDPGGGGINVARVVQRLGGAVRAIYPAGGSTGQLLRQLVEREGVPDYVIAAHEETREDFSVDEEKTGLQYRFVLPGMPLRAEEWQACLGALETLAEPHDVMVGSGSLPPDVPDDFYARAARIAKARGCRMVLDTSGRPLAAALAEGVHLVKPNLRELRELAGEPLPDEASWIKAARLLVDTGGAEVVALSLGHHGALAVSGSEILRAAALEITPVSSVGAGDSFLGAMVWSLTAGHPLSEALRDGVAAGSAAVLNQGTELCHADDVRRLREQVHVIAL